MTYNTTKVDKDNNDCEYKPLPNSITSYLAENMCGIVNTHQPGFRWDIAPLPELLLFVERVTMKAKIDVQTAIAALILVSRFKKRLPKNAHGEYGACHKIFLTALLIAAKEFMAKTKEEEEEEKKKPHSAPATCCSSPTPDDESPLNTNITDSDSSSDSSSTSDFDPLNNILLSSTPSSSSSASIAEEDDHDILPIASYTRNSVDFIHRRIIMNQKLSDISGLYSLDEVNQMERGFMKRLGNNVWVTEKDIKEYVENNKHALGIC